MKYDVKKLELRGVLDQTCEIVRDNQKMLFVMMLVSVIPLHLVMGLLTHYLTKTGQVEAVAIVAFLGGVVIGLPIYELSSGAVMYAVANLYLSRPTTVVDCYKRAARRFFPLVLASVLQWLAMFGGFLLLIIPGIIFGLWFSLAQVIVVLEGASGVEALKRSKALMKGNSANLLALCFILWYFNIQVGMSSSLLPNPYLRAVLTAFVQGLSILVTSASMAIFYVSARCQHENFDLQWLASKVAEPKQEPV